MSDKPSQNERELASIVTQFGMIAGQQILARLAENTDEGLRETKLNTLVVFSWEQIALPRIEEICLSRELDIRPLRQDQRYRDLYLSALERYVDEVLRAGERPSVRSVIAERARGLAEEVDLESCQPNAYSSEQRAWLGGGYAYVSWQERGRSELAGAFKRFQIDTEVERCQEFFCTRFAERCAERLAESPQRGQEFEAPALIWQHAGPRIPGTDGLPEPRFQSDYALAYDPRQPAIVYVQRLGESILGPLWQLRGDEWSAESESIFALGGEPCSRVSLHYDAGRDAMVAWLCLKHDVFKAVPVGVMFQEGSLRLVQITSDMPIMDRGREFSAVFAHDPGRRVTVAVTPEAIWQIDSNGYWTRCITREPGSATSDWPAYELVGAAYDRARQHVVIWALVQRADDTYQEQGRCFYMFAWNGLAITHIGTAGLSINNESSGEDAAIAICEHNQHGLLAYVARSRCFYRMTETGWQSCVLEGEWNWREHIDEDTFLPELDSPPTPDPYPGQAPPAWFRGVQAAYDPTHTRFVLGPGTYQISFPWGQSSRAVHAFYEARDRVWRKREYRRPEAPLVPSFEFITDGPDGPVAVNSSSAVHGFDPTRSDAWVPLIDDSSDMLRGSVIAVVRGQAGEVCMISEHGEIASLEKIAKATPKPNFDSGRLTFEPGKNYRWNRLYTPRDLPENIRKVLDSPGPYAQLCAAYDRRSCRIVLWRDEVRREPGNRTLVWQPDAWSEIARDSPIPASGRRQRERTRFVMLFDSAVERVVRFGAGEFAVFDQDSWHCFPADPVLAAVHPQYRTAVHDEASGQTLILDFLARRIVRFDLSGSILLCDYRWPTGYLATEKQDVYDPGFPLSRLGYLTKWQRLSSHSDSDLWENYQLDLVGVFARARTLGARTSYREFLAQRG